MPRAPTDLRSLARAWTNTGLHVLKGIATDADQPAAARVRAVELVWERGWGKAPATIAGQDGSGSIEVIVRHILDGSAPPKVIEHQD